MQDQIFHLQYAMDTFYFLVCGALVMWMAAGFAMLEAGLVRAKNTTEILTKNVALFAISCIMYLVCGYSIMYGGEWFLTGIQDVDVASTLTDFSGRDGGFPNNKIVIKHDDGTFAQYMHLTQNGALVEIGEEISQGDLIGSSGNTGLAGFPHLHFVLTKPGSYKYPYKSMPTTFLNTLANERSLAAGIEYPAYEY